MKTTKTHFAEFKKYHAEYLERFGLLQWRCEYSHQHLQDSYAETAMKFIGKVAMVALATNWRDTRPLNSESLRRLAKHEANHMLVHSLYWHATARYISRDTLCEAEESLVRTLDQLIPD